MPSEIQSYYAYRDTKPKAQGSVVVEMGPSNVIFWNFTKENEKKWQFLVIWIFVYM